MERFHLYLKPGERIRTPLVSLMFWNGDNLMTGQNKFRRFLLAHHSRQLDGKFAEYPYASGLALPGPEPCTENGCLTEEMAIAMARRHKQFNLVPEVFWLDAGWYTDSGAPVYDWCDCVGTWTPDTTRFPNGLRPLSDEAHRLGARFLLWFDPNASAADHGSRGNTSRGCCIPPDATRHCWTWAIPRHWNGSARTSAT